MEIVRVALPVPLPQLFDYTLENAKPEDVGRCVQVPFGNGHKNGVILEVGVHSALSAERLKPVHQVQYDVPALPADWLALVGFCARYYHAHPGEVVALALPPGLRRADAVRGAEPDPPLQLSTAGIAALEKGGRARALQLLAALHTHGTLRRSAVRSLPGGERLAEAMRRAWIEIPSPRDPLAGREAVPSPTAEQSAAIDTILAAREGFAAWLLHGVTGSGKTEVYLRLTEALLAAGRQILILVPEIGLTPQIERRVMRRFPAANIVSLHSAVAAGARSSGFVEALCGRADIVLGTRLAVFTPLPRLGLILVDEEHDNSYKQQEGVRYSARDLAVWRAHQGGLPIVLGSATPSLESWRHALSGRYRLLRLQQRALAAALPKVRSIDTRRVKLEDGLSPVLLSALGERLARGEQSLVFLNRRGYAPVLSCTACGWASPCPHCSANLVVHLADARLRCHHCGSESRLPRACPVCGNQDLQPFGRGTQRLEEGLAARFPQARILRLDRDAARTRSQWESLLAQVARKEADILVGTQIMAKGHDFPDLTLVGVIGADASLFAADFRASERLFAQLMQVGGRAGRASLPGEVLIQTEYPDHPLFECLGRHDFDAFAAHLLEERRRAAFPPWTHQAMLRADAPRMEDALQFLAAAQRLSQSWEIHPVVVHDPVPMRLSRLARRERAQLLAESPQRGALQQFLHQWRTALLQQRTPAELRWHLDVDPLEV